MKIVILRHGNGDTVALVPDSAVVGNLAFTDSVDEVDPSDSKRLIIGSPRLQAGLQEMFRDVMQLFGIRVKPPERVEGAVKAADEQH